MGCVSSSFHLHNQKEIEINSSTSSTIIKSKRLFLRTIEENDLSLYNKLFTDQKVMSLVNKYVTKIDVISHNNLWDESEIKKFFKDCLENRNNYYTFTIFENGQFNGIIHAKRSKKNNKTLNAFFLLDEFAWRQGKGTESMSAFLAFINKIHLDKNITNIKARVLSPNTPAIKILKNLGFHIKKSKEFENNTYYNTFEKKLITL